MEINRNTIMQEAKNKKVSSLSSMNEGCNNHSTIKTRDELELMNIINESLKKEEKYRTNGKFQQ